MEEKYKEISQAANEMSVNIVNSAFGECIGRILEAEPDDEKKIKRIKELYEVHKTVISKLLEDRNR